MRYILIGLSAGALALCLANCGTAVWTETPVGPPRDQIDGAVMSYALAKASFAVQAIYKGGALTLTPDSKPTAVPDIGPEGKLLRVVYNHSGLSNDDVEIDMNGALVTSISSNPADQTTAVLQNATSLLKQLSATQTAINTPTTAARIAAETATCSQDLQVTHVQGLTYRSEQADFPPQSSKNGCWIAVKVVPTLISEPIGVQAFARAGDDELTSAEICTQTYAFCFRLGGVYKLSISAVLYSGKKAVKTATVPDIFVTAPIAHQLGYVRFDRRAFVQNKTKITFDSSGLVSSFAATNPSEVVGFIALPTAVAATVAAAVVLHP